MDRGSQRGMMDLTIKISGEAGQGIQTIGETLARVFARSGLHVFAHQDYESRVRGGHNIPIGVIYRNDRTTYENLVPIGREKPLMDLTYDRKKVEGILREFY